MINDSRQKRFIHNFSNIKSTVTNKAVVIEVYQNRRTTLGQVNRTLCANFETFIS